MEVKDILCNNHFFFYPIIQQNLKFSILVLGFTGYLDFKEFANITVYFSPCFLTSEKLTATLVGCLLTVLYSLLTFS